jgi:hypothetical protein
MDEKFEDSKQKMVEGNEARYGKEARALYGDSVVDASNAKLMGLTIRQYRRVQELSNQINEKLEIACKQGDPSNPLAQEVCALHKEWLGFFWSHYSKEAHLGLAQMYVDDPRFKAYYDAVGAGCAEFLRDALTVFCQQS